MPPQNKHAIKCRQCGKTFMRIPSRKRIFCSLACHGLSRRIKTEIRFHSKVGSPTATGCLLWTGRIGKRGYGTIKIRGKQVVTHRLAWELANGPIPKGLCICHHCDVRACVNPAHLFLGTHLDNVRDAVNKVRLSRCRLTPDSVRQIRKSYDEGNSANELAAQYGVSRCTIMNIIRRRTWNHLDQSPPFLVQRV